MGGGELVGGGVERREGVEGGHDVEREERRGGAVGGAVDAGLAGVLADGVPLHHLETVQGLAVRLYQPDHSAVSY